MIIFKFSQKKFKKRLVNNQSIISHNLQEILMRPTKRNCYNLRNKRLKTNSNLYC